MGLSASDSVRLSFHHITADQAFPLALKVPTAKTRAAIAEVDRMIADKRARFTGEEALISDLDG